MDERAAVTVETVLAPVDGSDESATAIRYAVAIADRYDASVHALYVLGRGTVRGMDAGTIAEDDVAETTVEFLEGVEAVAATSDVPLSTSIGTGFSTTRKRIHPGSVVLDTADEVSADFIVVPREPLTDAETDVLEKAAEYVLAYASQPVLSV